MKNLSIKKITIISFFVAMLIFVVYLVINDFLVIRAIRQKTTESFYDSTEIIGTQLDQQLTGVETCMINKTFSADVLSIITDEYSDTQYYVELKKIRDRLNDDVSFFKYDSTMFVYYNDNDEIVMSGNQSETLEKELKALIQNYITHDDKVWKVINFNEKNSLMVVYCNELGIYAGLLITIESILQEWKDINLGAEMIQCFADSEKIYYLDGNNELLKDEYELKAVFDNNRDKNMFWKNDTLVAKYRILNGAYDIYVIADTSAHTNVLTSGIINLVCVSPLLAFVTFFTYYYILNKLLLQPLRQALTEVHTEMKKENIVLPSVHTFSEVNGIIKLFNNIFQKLQDFKIKLYEERIENERAKMRILRSRINPHMFMNSLTIINGMAKIKTEESSEIISKLTQYMSEYFRFIIESDNEFIDIQNELNNVENYLKIHCIRFPKLFHYVIEKENLKTVKIPPLILQPIVENSIKHGFNGYDHFMVSISCNITDNLLTITIKDNGAGFSDESLKMLKKCDSVDLYQQKHYGIMSVYELLKIAYHGKAYLKCFNDNGAVVEIIIQL